MGWASIDKSILEYLKASGTDIKSALDEFTVEYDVPYKEDRVIKEYALRIVKGGLNEESFVNVSKGITRNFGEHKKRVDGPGVQRKLNNTIAFLDSLR